MPTINDLKECMSEKIKLIHDKFDALNDKFEEQRKRHHADNLPVHFESSL